MELPVYELLITDDVNDDAEVSYVALVDLPAIKKNFLLFGDKQRFSVDNEDERIVTGALMLADMPIYRRDKERGEYNVVFKAPTIKQIAQKFFKKGFQNNVNLMHDPEQIPGGVYMFESWIIDRERGKMPMKGFEDVVDGSWFGSFKVENDEVWEQVKAGEFKGFSVEGIFDMAPVQSKTKEEEFLNELMNILKELGE